ncbi:M1 family peptidase [Novosphingobium umbonatum]|uniref:Aminopeptidase n=1 Tax=Novosphingobium umbonatum TaxID=1908524 RepID=A0A437N5J1_9SPHN|nr:M1 family metallopeptidase [Novosphingobium umbonatum]RVU05131.1 M1 family peptidase [Novosphingobium umbonatum]
MRNRLFYRALLSSSLLACAAMSQPALAARPVKADAKAPPPPAPAPAVVETPPPAPLGKLADAVRPAAYRLDLTLDPAQERFSGHVEIDATVKESSRFIYLHGRDLKVAKASATIGGKTYPATWSQVDETGVALLTFAEALPAGVATFAFDYDAAFSDGPAGLFRVKVGDAWYSWSQFESIDARAAFPSFDQPGYKQPFTVTLRTPKGLTAVSNAPEIETREEGGMSIHRFAPTAPLPTYLLAMMVGNFAVVESVVPPTPQRATPLPLRIISTRQNKDKLAFALENSKAIVAHLEDYFGQAFPYPKLDQITAPIMPGAMENAGADLYQDNLLVLDDKASTGQKRAFGMVVGHELAHQWFGDLVTPAWWDDIWLNESFANWMGYRIGNAWRPDLNIGKGALEEGFGAMNTDSLLAGRPIHQPITTNAQIDAAFDTITYGKGGHVVAMIAAFMGDEKFKAGVRAYMAAHRYGNATSAEFFGAMAQVSGDPRILPAMQSFTDQQGLPLVSFTKNTDGSYTATQSRYARFGTTAPEQKWGVPLCLRMGAERSCQLLDTVSTKITVKGKGPLMPNAGGTGYYRFELPKADWDALIASSASLSGGEGLALADSLRASFMAGRASAAQLAQLARVMVANPDSYASDAAGDGLAALEGWGMLDAKAEGAYRAFVGKLYGPLLAKAGFNPAKGAYAGEAAEVSQRRAQLVGKLVNDARDPALRAKLAAAAQSWLDGKQEALDASWYRSGFSTWLDAQGKTGGGSLTAAKTLFERAIASQDPLLRPSLLGVIASSGKEDVATWILSDAKDKRLRLSERLQLVAGVASNRKTRDMGYDWIRSHLDELLGGSGGIFLASRLPQVFAGYCSVEKADAIAKDFAPKLAGKTGALELERTIERVRSCGKLKDARSAEASAQIAKLK